jgi:hypothetical protein
MRRKLNQALFRKLFIDVDEVTSVEFNPPFETLLEADRAFVGLHASEQTKATPENRGGLQPSDVDALLIIASGDVSSNANLVGAEGFEPPTLSV